MKRSSHNFLAQRGRLSSDRLRARETETHVFRSLDACARACRRIGIFASCVGLIFVITSESTDAQEQSQTTPATSIASKKEQLVNRLQALRAASAEQEVVPEPEEPEELFLDLSNGSTSAVSDQASPQAMASTLGVSMSSSPTQVLMRAVAWIAIVLCVCCLGILGARRWQRERGLLPTISSQSKVIETLSLGPGRTVSLIEMHGYRALVATDAGGIRSLVLAPSPFEDSLLHEEANLAA